VKAAWSKGYVGIKLPNKEKKGMLRTSRARADGVERKTEQHRPEKWPHRSTARQLTK